MGSETIQIRTASEQDWPIIERILSQAFGSQTETRLVTALREDGVLSLALLGLLDHHPVGFLAASPVTLEPVHHEDRLSGIGPVAVLPKYQRRGVGSALVKAALANLDEAGHTAVVVLGHAEYYGRFGFCTAQRYGLRCTFETPPARFMVYPLQPDALIGRSGTVHYRTEFHET